LKGLAFLLVAFAMGAEAQAWKTAGRGLPTATSCRARREFIRNGILPVILDSPSDQQAGDGMSDAFRESREHATGGQRARQVLAGFDWSGTKPPESAPCEPMSNRKQFPRDIQ
jgi:hypothetical protein